MIWYFAIAITLFFIFGAMGAPIDDALMLAIGWPLLLALSAIVTTLMICEMIEHKGIPL